MNQLLEYFNGDELAASVWKSKYYAEGESTPDDMHRRMAREFARIRFTKDGSKTITEWEDFFFFLFRDFRKIIAQGRVMAGLGVRETYRSLSNCLVLPSPQDSYSSILYTDASLVAAAKRGCGYGLDLSHLRPSGSEVRNAAGSSTGMASFMERYSNSTREVAQEGRRGACLLSVDVRHPDVDKFITAKDDPTKVTGANVSVKLNDDFMTAVESDGDYVLRWPCDTDYSLFLPPMRNGEQIDVEYNTLYKVGVLENMYDSHASSYGFIKRVRARDIFNLIVKHARDNAEPGVFFWDRVIDYDPASVYEDFKAICTNACGEQPMSFGDTCRLVIINLLSVVKNPYTDNAYIDYDLLNEYVQELARIGDDMVDLELEYVQRIIDKIHLDPEPYHVKIPEIKLWERVKYTASQGRRMGGGITALGDMLAALGVKYDSPEALKIVEDVMREKQRAELEASIEMAKSYGPFPAWDNSLEYPDGLPANSFYQHLQDSFPDLVSEMQKVGRRSMNWSTIAPTGSTSILAKGIWNCNLSSGCEPQFMLYYTRRKKINPSDPDSRVDFVDQNGDQWMEYPVVMGAFKDWLQETGRCSNPSLLSTKDIEAYYEESPWYKSTSNDINWETRVQIQSILQTYTTSAISTTLNLPSTVTESDVADIYMSSWKHGNKGQTIYRDGSRTGVLVSNSSSPNAFTQHDAPKRPKSLDADLYHVTAMGRRWTVCVGLMDDKPYEVFASYGEFGTNGQRGQIIKQRKKQYAFISDSEHVNGDITATMTGEEAALTRMISTSLRHGTRIEFVIDQLSAAEGPIVSFSKAIARTLKKYIIDNAVTCVDCGSVNIIMSEGCAVCGNCGSSKCG